MTEFETFVCETLSKKLGENIVVIDMRTVSPFTDSFILTTARNVRHAASLADETEREMLKHGGQVRKKEGAEGSTWILLDLYETVVHIFTEEARMQYRLENLWADRPSERYTDQGE